MSRTNYYKILSGAFLYYMALSSFAQNFSERYNASISSAFFHIVNVQNGYLAAGPSFDSLDGDLLYQVNFMNFDLQGNVTNVNSIYDSTFFWNINIDSNYSLPNEIIAFSGLETRDDSDSIYSVLVYVSENGNTIASNRFTSPYFQIGVEETHSIITTALTTDAIGEFVYMVSQVVDYPPVQNNFIIRKINAQGQIVWTYINPLNEWYYSANGLTYRSDTLWFISIASGNEGNFNKLIGLNPDSGEVVFEVEHNGTTFPVGGCSDMILTEEGPVIACTIGSADDNGSLPFLYKMDFDGNYLWQSQPEGEFDLTQRSSHLIQSNDGGFVSCGEKYDTYPNWPSPNNEGSTNTMQRIWLWKVDANGNFLWQRFYSYYDFDYSSEYFHLTNVAHDMKATPDGGFIMAGEASASCTDYPDCDNFTQQGWLLKVDACGCLVPGCDPNCIVSVEETEADNEKKYFRFGPNPVGETLNIFLASDEHINLDHATLEVRDLMGRLIRSLPLPHNNTTYIIDAQSLTAGNYFLTLTKDGQVLQSEKMVKR